MTARRSMPSARHQVQRVGRRAVAGHRLQDGRLRRAPSDQAAIGQAVPTSSETGVPNPAAARRARHAVGPTPTGDPVAQPDRARQRTSRAGRADRGHRRTTVRRPAPTGCYITQAHTPARLQVRVSPQLECSRTAFARRITGAAWLPAGPPSVQPRAGDCRRPTTTVGHQARSVSPQRDVGLFHRPADSGCLEA
jgi:hypothetical protein